MVDGHTNQTDHIHTGSNVAGYLCRGAHSALGSDYATNSYDVAWSGNSAWWIIHTIESANGLRSNTNSNQGFFLQYFSTNSFGGSAWSNTPVGAITTVHEPFSTQNDDYKYFNYWASGRNFAICAWESMEFEVSFLQAVGDPFVRK